MGSNRLALQWALALCAVLGCTCATAVPNSSNPPAKKRVVCWTEEKGRRSCGDAVPPQYAAQEKRILDEKGRLVRVIPAQLSTAQREVKEAEDRKAEATKAEADKQAAYDRSLLATYSTAQEIAALRDDRLATIDSSIEAAEAAAKRDEASLADLRKHLPAADSKDKPPPILLKNIEHYQTALDDSRSSSAELRKKRDGLCVTFARDIKHFQVMKDGSANFESPCPAPGSLKKIDAPLGGHKSAP